MVLYYCCQRKVQVRVIILRRDAYNELIFGHLVLFWVELHVDQLQREVHGREQFGIFCARFVEFVLGTVKGGIEREFLRYGPFKLPLHIR